MKLYKINEYGMRGIVNKQVFNQNKMETDENFQ